jgi:CDP-glycerol glycerophosphotransferase (TagB/SpsB family)
MDDILNFYYNDIKEILPEYKIIIKEHPMDI